MTTLHFDTLYYDHVEGEIADPIVKDQDNTENYVLELDRDWKVEVNWKLTSDSPASHPVDLIDGTWEVKVGVESLGPGDEKYFPGANVDLGAFDTSSAAKRTWKKEFNISAGEITTEGVYQLVTLITYRDPAGARRAMAGFMEGPLISLYKDQP